MANPKRRVYDPIGKAVKGVCLSMVTHKDQEIDRAVRKYTKGLINSKTGACPNVMTYEDQEVDRVAR